MTSTKMQLISIALQIPSGQACYQDLLLQDQDQDQTFKTQTKIWSLKTKTQAFKIKTKTQVFKIRLKHSKQSPSLKKPRM